MKFKINLISNILDMDFLNFYRESCFVFQEKRLERKRERLKLKRNRKSFMIIKINYKIISYI